MYCIFYAVTIRGDQQATVCLIYFYISIIIYFTDCVMLGVTNKKYNTFLNISILLTILIYIERII